MPQGFVISAALARTGAPASHSDDFPCSRFKNSLLCAKIFPAPCVVSLIPRSLQGGKARNDGHFLPFHPAAWRDAQKISLLSSVFD